MEMLKSFYDAILAFSSWVSAFPLVIVLVVCGVVFTIDIRGVQFTRLGYILRKNLKGMFNPAKEGEEKNGVTKYQAFLQNLGGTVGTGNIVGVGTAIALGGPGALLWMWISGLLAMAIKYSESVFSTKYRQKNKHAEGYQAGPYMYIRYGLGCTWLAVFFGVFRVIKGCCSGASHAKSVAGALSTLNIPPIVILVFLETVIIWQMAGGLKRAVKVSDILVPWMTVIYSTTCLIIIFMHIGNLGSVLEAVFVGAFSGTAATGGFVGSALSMTIRQGMARGVYSNDAGQGDVMMAQAEHIEHPAGQGCLAILETFIDTFIVCSLTGLAILTSGVWDKGFTGDIVVLEAFRASFGTFGQYMYIVCFFIFVITSVFSGGNAVKFHTLNCFNDNIRAAHTAQTFYVIMLGVGCIIPTIAAMFAITDFFSTLAISANLLTMLYLHKQLRETSDDYWKNVVKGKETERP